MGWCVWGIGGKGRASRSASSASQGASPNATKHEQQGGNRPESSLHFGLDRATCIQLFGHTTDHAGQLWPRAQNITHGTLDCLLDPRIAHSRREDRLLRKEVQKVLENVSTGLIQALKHEVEGVWVHVNGSSGLLGGAGGALSLRGEPRK